MATLENPFGKVRPKLTAARIQLISQLSKFGHDELTRSPSPDEWSALEIAHHIYVAEGLALEQMQLIQNEDNPLLVASEEEAPRLTRASEPPASLEAVLAGIVARREEIFEFLNSIPPEAWERPYRHPYWGQFKFYQIVNILVQHDQLHARQLGELKAAIAPVQS
jgi:hypothetical protein